MGTALRLVDLHHGGVQCLKVEQAQRLRYTPKIMTIHALDVMNFYFHLVMYQKLRKFFPMIIKMTNFKR